MRRAKFDESSDAPAMPLQALKSCMFCGRPTAHDTLATLGARCAPCYRNYCESASKPTPDVGDKRKGNPKEWAHALKAREEAGEILSSVQRTMWRAALRQGEIHAEAA